MQNTIQQVIQVPLEDVRSKDYDSNEEKCGKHEPCFICGRPLKEGQQRKWVQYLTSGHIVSTDQELDNSQGFFPVGNDCAKKLVITFTFDVDK